MKNINEDGGDVSFMCVPRCGGETGTRNEYYTDCEITMHMVCDGVLFTSRATLITLGKFM